MAVWPDDKMPLWCQLNISKYDYTQVLKVDMEDLENRYEAGERLFFASFRDQNSPAAMQMEVGGGSRRVKLG